MANQGILAQSKPSANTNTVLYSAPIDSSASAVLTVANDGTGSAYKVGLKNYDQKLVLDASTYLLHKGDAITDYRFTVNTAIAASNSSFVPSTKITSDDKESSLIFESFYTPPTTTIYIKKFAARIITLESINGTFAVGQTITKGTGGNTTVATILASSGEGASAVTIGPSTINGSGSEFADGDAVTASGGATGTVSTGGVGSATNEFAYSVTTAGGTYNLYLTDTLTVFNDRIYRFDNSDSSMSGLDWSLSATVNGEWGPDNTAGTEDDGTEYTTGRTVVGTAGSGGTAYIQYDFSQGTPPDTLYTYEGTTGTAANSGYGGSDRSISVSNAPTYTEFYAYDIDGTWTNSTDTFTVAGVTYTVTAQTAGPYGYVRKYDGTSLYVVKGIGSADFSTDTFRDVPKLGTAARSTVTVNSVAVATTALEAENYIVDGVTNGNNEVDKITSIVVGPAERVVINSTTANNSFSLVGFEDVTTGFTTQAFNQSSTGGGEGGG